MNVRILLFEITKQKLKLLLIICNKFNFIQLVKSVTIYTKFLI